MNEESSKNRLGRGLAALIGEMDTPRNSEVKTAPDRVVPVEFIGPNPHNPRRNFAEGELDDLARSIRQFGIVQPVVVRQTSGGPVKYEIIAGERRWRAAQRAELSEVPVIIRNVDDRVALELAIVENVQRSDLNPIEEGLGYQQLIDEHNYTQAELANVIGKSRSHVANTLRLLKLPDVVRSMLIDGSISAGHARTLVTAENPQSLAERIARDGLSVRQAEALQAAPATKDGTAGPGGKAEKDADTLALEKLLTDTIGMKVVIRHGDKGGNMKVNYTSLEQLDELCRLLKGGGST